MEDHITPQFKFEERIKTLLKSFNFNQVNGGPSFKIGNNQIDACGKCDDKLIIFECTTQRTNLRSKLEEFKGKIPAIKRGLDNISEFRDNNKKNKLAFIFVSKSPEILQYKDLAMNDQKIFLMDLNKITYYEKIAKAVPNRAKYDLLSDLGFILEKEESIFIPAFKIKYKDIDIYNFFISPDDLIKISYVARRENLREKDFYQRMINSSRLKQIEKFIDKGGIFPTNIVISINEEVKFNELNIIGKNLNNFQWLSVGILELPKNYDSCWIIDGQHRLFSFSKGASQKLSVLAFDNISLNKQTEFFVSINRNAKPIDTKLIWDLEGDLRPNSKEGIVSNIVKNLNNLDPFKNNISIPSIGSGSISITSFCEAILKTQLTNENIKIGTDKSFIKNPYFHTDYQTHIKSSANAISLYFNSICNCISPSKEYIKEFILDNGGVSVFMSLYKIIICLEQKKIGIKEIEKYIMSIIDFFEKKDKTFIDQYKKRCSSGAGQTDILKEILVILLNINPDISKFMEEKKDLKDKLIELEHNLRRLTLLLFKEKMINVDKIRNNFPNMLKEAEIRLHKEIKNIDEFCGELSLGEIKEIILRYWKDIFRNIFIKGTSLKMIENQFPMEDIFKAKLELSNNVRNKLIHSKVLDLSIEDENEVKNFTQRVSYIIDATLNN